MHQMSNYTNTKKRKLSKAQFLMSKNLINKKTATNKKSHTHNARAYIDCEGNLCISDYMYEALCLALAVKRHKL